MIRLNVSLLIEDSARKAEIMDLATRLVEQSLRDKGCIDYDLYASTTESDRLLIYETWADEAALNTHMQSDHFRTIVPQLKDLATLTLERFDF